MKVYIHLRLALVKEPTPHFLLTEYFRVNLLRNWIPILYIHVETVTVFYTDMPKRVDW